MICQNRYSLQEARDISLPRSPLIASDENTGYGQFCVLMEVEESAERRPRKGVLHIGETSAHLRNRQRDNKKVPELSLVFSLRHNNGTTQPTDRPDPRRWHRPRGHSRWATPPRVPPLQPRTLLLLRRPRRWLRLLQAHRKRPPGRDD